MKLVRRERETPHLAELLARSPSPPIASALVRVELRRAVAHAGGGVGSPEAKRAEAILREIDLVAIDDALLDAAGRLDAPGLRSPDAIHLASALLVAPDLAALVTYDRRMLAAADRLRLPVVAPGASA